MSERKFESHDRSHTSNSSIPNRKRRASKPCQRKNNLFSLTNNLPSLNSQRNITPRSHSPRNTDSPKKIDIPQLTSTPLALTNPMSKTSFSILIYSLCLALPAYAVDDANAIFGTRNSNYTSNSNSAQTLPSELLRPFKNDQFVDTALLAEQDNGNYLEFDFNEMRDVNGRDEIPVKKALNKFVEISEQTNAKDLTLNFPAANFATAQATITAAQVGTTRNAKFAVVFIHGAGGSKELGVNDWTFGGNFNRLKNLTLKNQGVYFSPTVTFDMNGIQGTAEIIKHIKHESPNSKIILACGSAGSFICWNLLTTTQQAKNITSLVILGGAFAPDAPTLNAIVKNQTTIILSHGTNDRVLNWREMEKAYNEIKNETPSQLIIYRTGGHGTPIRMIDWYKTLTTILITKAKK